MSEEKCDHEYDFNLDPDVQNHLKVGSSIDFNSPSGRVVKRNNDIDLYNEILAGLSLPQKSFSTYHKTKRGEYDIKKFRSDMINAERMKLSENFVENAVALSFSYPKYFNQLIPNAIPAFDTLWIEWDELKRFYCLQDHFVKMGCERNTHDHNVSNRIGYLIKNHGDYFEYSLIICDQIGDSKKPQIMTPLISWYLANDADVKIPPSANHLLQANYEKGNFTSENDLNRYGLYYASKFLKSLISPVYLGYHNDQTILTNWVGNVQVTPHPLFFSMHLYSDALVNYDNDKTNRLIDLAAHATEGDLRFLVSVFALLNYPRFVRELKSPKRVSGIRWGKQLPKNEVKVIEIELPKRGVNVYEQLWTGHGKPKRQHVRRGHWRVYKDQFGHVKERKWINPMVCGNPELGIIDHEYVLRVKKDRKGEKL